MRFIQSTLAIIIVSSFASSVSATSFNRMSKTDKAKARNTSVSAQNTASRAAAAQSSGTGGASAAVQARNAAITADHNAKIGAQLTKANLTRTQQQIDANKAARLAAQRTTKRQTPVPGTAQPSDYQNPHAFNPQAVSQVNVPVGTSLKNITLAKSAAAAKKPANSIINMSVSRIPTNTPVTVTINGNSITTTAGVLAKIDPQAQVAMPVISVFSPTPRKGGQDQRSSSNTHGETGNGSQNAANSRSGVAHGFGGNHVGGGSAQSGSRSVGKW